MTNITLRIKFQCGITKITLGKETINIAYRINESDYYIVLMTTITEADTRMS